MREKIIAGNWKMNKDSKECYSFFRGIGGMLRRKKAPGHKGRKKRMIICPPFTCLFAAARASVGLPVELGCQDMHFKEKGAFTGEISARMLSEFGIRYAILGHSERRKYFRENDSLISRKVEAALENGIIPILCVGENLRQRKAKKEKTVVGHQLEKSLSRVRQHLGAKVIIAYEPVWAIGTGMNATEKQVGEMHSFIRKNLGSKFGSEAASKAIILYGGSVNRDNAYRLARAKDVDGFLLGGASLEPAHFLDIAGKC